MHSTILQEHARHIARIASPFYGVINTSLMTVMNSNERHSVRITGELEEAIQTKLFNLIRNSWSCCIPDPIHVELRPQLKENEKYVEIRQAVFDTNTKASGVCS